MNEQIDQLYASCERRIERLKEKQSDKESRDMSDRRDFCKMLSDLQEAEHERQNYPRAKTLKFVMDKVKEYGLWVNY